MRPALRPTTLWLLAGGLAVFLLSLFSINTDTGSDPQFTLVVAQSIIDNGSGSLDAYRDDTVLGDTLDGHLQRDLLVENSAGHIISYFPLGPSLLSTPFVAVARLLGADMRQAEDNFDWQVLLSALSTMLVFWLAYALARIYVTPLAALVIAFVSVMGSSLLSTLGTALWSHNFAVLFLSVALWLLARNAAESQTNLRPVLLGVALALAFVSRPTAAAFVAPVLLCLLIYRRRAFPPVAIASAAVLGLYLLASRALLGEAWPAYFSTARLLVERAPLAVGIAGNLISPSRGILWFSPFLWPVLIGYLVYWRRVSGPIVWLCLVWFALHLLMIARAASWWGGWSFGPRLLTDLWPGLVLLTALLWQTVTAGGDARAAKALAIAYLALGLAAMFNHAIRGLYSQSASVWNGLIEPGRGSGDLFDWRRSQLLATNEQLCAIRAGAAGEQLSGNSLEPYNYGRRLDAVTGVAASISGEWEPAAAAPAPEPAASRAYLSFVSSPTRRAVLIGWADSHQLGEQSYRWSICDAAELVVWPGEPLPGEAATLALTGYTLGAQRVEVSVNGQDLGALEWDNQPGMAQTRMLAVPSELLAPRSFNVIRLTFPDAHWPDLRDQRPLGLALAWFSLGEATDGVEEMPLPPNGYPAP